jgi:hypothetical protein
MKRTAACVILTLSMMIPSRGRADTDPHDYEALASLPIDTVITNVYLRHTTSSDQGAPTTNLGIFRGSYVHKFGNLVVVPFDVLLPVADVTVQTYTPPSPISTGTITGSGIGDLEYLPTIAYIIPEDKETHTHTVVAFTPYLTLPSGQYDQNSLVNIGSHRWTIKPQIAVAQRFAKILTAEATGFVSASTHNTKFGVPTATGIAIGTLTQDPTFGAEVHLAVDVNPTFFGAVSYYVTSNGSQTVDLAGPVTAPVAGTQTVQTLRFTWATYIEKQSLLLLQFNQDVTASNKANITRFIGLRFSHIFY